MVYPQINNDIEYGLFENIIDSYYLDSQIDILDTRPQCTHTYDHISQQLNSLADTEKQHKVYMSIQCAFNIISSTLETKAENHTEKTSQSNTGIHFHSKH